MIVSITNEQGLLEVEAHVDVYTEEDPVFGIEEFAEVRRVWVEGVNIPLSSLSDYLLDELQQQALEEAQEGP